MDGRTYIWPAGRGELAPWPYMRTWQNSPRRLTIIMRLNTSNCSPQTAWAFISSSGKFLLSIGAPMLMQCCPTAHGWSAGQQLGYLLTKWWLCTSAWIRYILWMCLFSTVLHFCLRFAHFQPINSLIQIVYSWANNWAILNMLNVPYSMLSAATILNDWVIVSPYFNWNGFSSDSSCGGCGPKSIMNWGGPHHALQDLVCPV